MTISDYLPVYRKNLTLAIPVIFAQIGQVTVNLADTMMVGHVGTIELAASSFAINVFHVGMLFGLGITLGITPLVGQSFNSQNPGGVGGWLKNGVLVHFISAVLLCLLMSSVVFFMGRMGQSEEVVRAAIPYFLIQVASLLPMMIFFSMKQFFEGVGNTKIAMIITIIANLVNIGLNYILIFGKLGFPALGLNGAGYATLIARLIMPVIFLLIILKRPSFKVYFYSAKKAGFEIKKIMRMLSVGLSIGMQMIIEILAFSVGAIMLGWISKEALAGHQVAIGMAGMTYMISFGLASGTTIRVSHAFGDRDRNELKHVVFASLHIVIAFMSLMGILFVVLRNQLPLLFTNDPEVIRLAAGLLVVGALFQIFDGVQVVLLGALRGMADVRIPMFIAFFSYIVVSLPISYLLAFVFNLGSPGVWIGFVFGLGTAAVLFGFRLKYTYRRVAHLS
ncbi:MAG: MATE family efflux transporter [Bacteroidota bacterium]|nr:MATE family efflux transporter [Odoribacter sp.]MDP3645322.1 MATE family efflux transporter [Bacteroidota bacterium]